MRSLLAEVRNPVLGLPAIKKLQALPQDQRDLIADLLRELSLDAHGRAHKAWAKSKGPMAAYWKAVEVYAKHVRAAMRRGLS